MGQKWHIVNIINNTHSGTQRARDVRQLSWLSVNKTWIKTWIHFNNNPAWLQSSIATV